MAINKIIYGGDTLIDLTADTVAPESVLKDVTYHGANGEAATGTCTYDADTQDATAKVAEVLTGKTFYGQGQKKTGTMPNNGAINLQISEKNGKASIAQGYHDGSGSVTISSVEQAKIIASNIKEGVSILGVKGSYTGEGVKAQTKTVVPKITAQTVLPDSGYDYLSQVTVAKISYAETPNSAGGTTVTIAG